MLSAMRSKIACSLAAAARVAAGLRRCGGCAPSSSRLDGPSRRRVVDLRPGQDRLHVGGELVLGDARPRSRRSARGLGRGGSGRAGAGRRRRILGAGATSAANARAAAGAGSTAAQTAPAGCRGRRRPERRVGRRGRTARSSRRRTPRRPGASGGASAGAGVAGSSVGLQHLAVVAAERHHAGGLRGGGSRRARP